jgi:spiro-SPASM protein
MKRALLVCCALDLRSRDTSRVPGGRDIYRLTLARLRSEPLSGLDCVLIREEGEDILPASLAGETGVCEARIRGSGAHEVLTLLKNTYPDYAHYIFADIEAPFVDPQLYLQFLERNEEAIAHYTYGEHYPRGVAPRVLSREAVEVLSGVSSARNFPSSAEALCDLMGLDINSYDIEMVVSEEDFRRWRLDLRIQDAYAYALFECLVQKEPALLEHAPYALLSATLMRHPEILRTLPCYLELDLSGACQLACRFCPRTLPEFAAQNTSPVSRDALLALVRELAQINPGATLALSPFSEPLLSGDFSSVTEEALALGLRVVIETNGLALEPERRAFLAGLDPERSIIILSPDYAHAELYREAKGKDALADLDEKMRQLLRARKRNVWLQIIQFEESDEEMDAFYAKWKEYEDAILPRKYNNWCGRLAGEAAIDLSPIRRSPCWHLARDMVVHADGSVRLCKQDPGGCCIAGNVFEEGLRVVWERLQEAWMRHLAGGGTENAESGWGYALCQACDEWHTFNY